MPGHKNGRILSVLPYGCETKEDAAVFGGEKNHKGESCHCTRAIGGFPWGKLCFHAGLCLDAPYGRHPVGNKKYMKHLEADVEDASIAGWLHASRGSKSICKKLSDTIVRANHSLFRNTVTIDKSTPVFQIECKPPQCIIQ